MSNETKWTPGPWLRDAASGLSCDVRASSGRKVALCWGLSTTRAARENRPGYRAECNANANLIATAPELYEALDLMLQRYGYETCEYVQKSQIALAKARGEVE